APSRCPKAWTPTSSLPSIKTACWKSPRPLPLQHCRGELKFEPHRCRSKSLHKRIRANECDSKDGFATRAGPEPSWLMAPGRPKRLEWRYLLSQSACRLTAIQPQITLHAVASRCGA